MADSLSLALSNLVVDPDNDPFTCTFLCGSTFSSPVSWRQHETSAHRQPELWHCSLATSSNATATATTTTTTRDSSFSLPPSTATTAASTSCAENFFDLQLYTEHLHDEHGITATVALNPAADDDADTDTAGAEQEAYDTEQNHVYANGQRNFWCGFCVKPVALETTGVDAWEERLVHVAEHLGEGKRVGDGGWVGLKDVEY